MKCFLLLIITTLLSVCSYAQVLTEEEQKLYDLVMKYRQEKGLPVIPVSQSLTFVAQTHVKDLEQNTSRQGNCNMHSWSDKGKWSPCCYTPDHANASCMWNKPRQLTSYRGNGYEIAFGLQFGPMTADAALAGWKSSPGHNAVILNEDNWKSDWKAIGIGISEKYAVIWFGNVADN